MTVEIHLNQVGFPVITEIPEKKNLPGIGEKIIIDSEQYQRTGFEVTEIKKDEGTGRIHIYVNPTT